MNKKIFLIGWDGATWNVLEPFIKRGWMPNLARLVAEGLTSKLESVIPPLTAPAWVSFMTGKNPGKHGIFDFRNFDSYTKKDYITNISYCRSKTIWEILTESGKKSIVLNLPYMYPPLPINGIVISGFDAIASNNDFIYPEEIKKKILDRWPNYRPAMPVWDYRFIEDRSVAREYFLLAKQSIETRIEVADFLVNNYEWDIFLAHFQEIDYIQHAFWHEIEKIIDGKGSFLLKEIESFFKVLDSSLSKLPFFHKDENRISFLISDHGFGAHPGMIFPNVLLKRWGFLSSRENFIPKIKHWIDKTLVLYKRFSLFRGRHLFFLFRSKKQRRRKSEWIVHEKMKTSIENLDIDWKKTKAIMATGDFYALIFINRDIVKKDTYEAVVTQLKSLFKEAKHTNGEGPLFKFVFSSKEIYSWECDYNFMPDLILVPFHGYSVTRDITTDRIVQYGFPGVSGIHRKDGILVIQGICIKKDLHQFEAKIVDLSPTILYLLNLEIPFDMDGKVWQDVFTFQKNIAYSKVASQKTSKQIIYSQAEEEKLKEKLKSLGYLQ